LLCFEVSEADVERLADALAAALDGFGWYVDFRTAQETFVVFAGRVFRYVEPAAPVVPRWRHTPVNMACRTRKSTGRRARQRRPGHCPLGLQEQSARDGAMTERRSASETRRAWSSWGTRHALDRSDRLDGVGFRS